MEDDVVSGRKCFYYLRTMLSDSEIYRIFNSSLSCLDCSVALDSASSFLDDETNVHDERQRNLE
jgi:hypothetical protein